MKKLNLPVIRTSLPRGKTLSMDDYCRFVEMYLAYTFNRLMYEKRKRIGYVGVPFKLKQRRTVE